MIDKFTIFLPHVLMAIAVWRLLSRGDLDGDPNFPAPGKAAPKRKARRRDA